MSTANSGIHFAVSRLSVNDLPSRIRGSIAELRCRSSRLVIDSAAISHDSTIVIPPASSVAKDRAACDAVICTSSLPARGSFNIALSSTKRPGGVRDQMNRPTDPTTSAGTTQIAYAARSEEHTSELQSRQYLVCRLLLEKKKQ